MWPELKSFHRQTSLPPSKENKGTEESSAPISPYSPLVPFWPTTASIDHDFDREHPDYPESP